MIVMAEIRFLEESGAKVSFSATDSANVERARQEAARWAEASGYSIVTFHLEEGSPQRLRVQFNDSTPLNSWLDANVVRQGRLEELESFLDYARGEQRRRDVGYEVYDL